MAKHEYKEVLNKDGSLTIPLQYPFKDPTGAEITSVTLTRMKQKEMKAQRRIHKNNEDDFSDAIVAKAANLTIEDVGEMDMEDFAYVQERFSQMVGVGSAKGNE